MDDTHWDWIIVGSGFGGSVSALRLAEKGYRVLVLERGDRFSPGDFPRTNWNLRRWLWAPRLGLRGIFRMSFLDHVTVLHGVGVGGGSLVYANTLAGPPDDFFRAPSWGHLADWRAELAPHFATALRMLGAATNPRTTRADRVLAELARESGLGEGVRPARVGVHFGTPGVTVPDPYFGGRGPERTGCTHCGACMTGCRVGAKNTLDRNYLHLAEGLGARVEAATEVTAVRPLDGAGGATGYRIETRGTRPGRRGATGMHTARQVIFAGGVMGTVPLLLSLRDDPRGLPRLSSQVGRGVRTNSESLIGIVTPDHDDLAEGVAITSLLRTGPDGHLEPVRYGPGSGFFRLLLLPHAPGGSAPARLRGAFLAVLRRPWSWIRALTVRDFARHSLVLLQMRTLEETLALRRGRSPRARLRGGVVSVLEGAGPPPAAHFPEATAWARRVAERLGGVPVSLLTETLRGVPSTAHILGGACMGAGPDEGVVDRDHRVFGYRGLYVIDGSAVSANPGVNPSLTITALAERALAGIPQAGTGEASGDGSASSPSVPR